MCAHSLRLLASAHDKVTRERSNVHECNIWSAYETEKVGLCIWTVHYLYTCARSEFLTVRTMKIIVFWDVIPYNLVDHWQKSIKLHEITSQKRVISSLNTDWCWLKVSSVPPNRLQIILIILSSQRAIGHYLLVPIPSEQLCDDAVTIKKRFHISVLALRCSSKLPLTHIQTHIICTFLKYKQLRLVGKIAPDIS